MTRISYENELCPIARVAALIGDHWTLLIFREAFLGVVQFGRFESELGIARNILSDRLKRLVDAGLFDRVRSPDDGRIHEYRLSEAGRALQPTIISLLQWSQNWLADGCAQIRVVERATGRDVRPVTVQAADGRSLTMSEIEFRPSDEADPRVVDRYKRVRPAAG